MRNCFYVIPDLFRDQLKIKLNEKEICMKWNGLFAAFSLVALSLFAAGCSDNDVAGGSSGDMGFTAVVNKKIAGVTQKGPFVKGSSIVLKEVSADRNLEPTGREFFAMTRSSKGDFKIDSLNLVSQYVRLTATGYYERETTGKNSECQISLNALSDISYRDTVNINVLTHLEFGRTIRLIKDGKTYDDAKKQAYGELMKLFHYDELYENAENLDITHDGEADKALKNISSFIDFYSYSCFPNLIHGYVNDHDVSCVEIGKEHERYCSEIQEFIDNIANTFASSGKFPEELEQFVEEWFERRN